MNIRSWIGAVGLVVLGVADGGAAGADPDAASVAALTPARGPLRQDHVNPRYFSDDLGRIVYLTGSHTWGNLRDRGLTDPPPPFDFTSYLDFLAAHNHNFFRLWTWEQPYSWNNNTDMLFRHFTPFPWLRSGPGTASDGKARFDLTKLDQSYFDRIRQRVVAAGNRGMYVAITLFDGWDVARAYNAGSGGFPYGSGNNVNGISSDGIPSQTLANSAVTQVQDAYVRKVVDTVNDLDNVLYEIANESDPSSVQWQYHMINLIKQYEAGKPKQHPVGMSTCGGGCDTDLTNSPADWIAPLARFLPGNGRKVIINDTDHSFYWTELKAAGPNQQRAWAWETLMIGASPAFMDPYLEAWPGRNAPNGSTPDPSWDVLRNALGATRVYADKLDLAHALPSGSLSSTGYCLANPGRQYLVYQPSSGSFTLNVPAGSYSYEWFNPASGSVTQTGTTALVSGARTFTPPSSGDAVLLLSLPGSASVPALGPFGISLSAVVLLAAGLGALKSPSKSSRGRVLTWLGRARDRRTAGRRWDRGG
jgi:hypothetical protein